MAPLARTVLQILIVQMAQLPAFQLLVVQQQILKVYAVPVPLDSISRMQVSVLLVLLIPGILIVQLHHVHHVLLARFVIQILAPVSAAPLAMASPRPLVSLVTWECGLQVPLLLALPALVVLPAILPLVVASLVLLDLVSTHSIVLVPTVFIQLGALA